MIAPYLALSDAAAAVDFYETVLGAELFYRVDAVDGSIEHARMRVLGSVFLIYEHNATYQFGVLPPDQTGSASCLIRLNVPSVEDVDAILARAREAGAVIYLEPQTMPWGQYYARFGDPFGHVWAIGDAGTDSVPESG
ncbi:MAG: VOC family protein [Pseudomonadota bacterium]